MCLYLIKEPQNKYQKLIKLKVKTDKTIIIVGDLNTLSN